MKFIYAVFRWYGILRACPVWLLFFKPKVYYADKSVQSTRIKGGALVISNHYNVFDFMLTMGLVLPRFLRVVSAEFPYRNKFLSFGISCFGGIKADRNTKSMRFVDESVDCIRKGGIVEIFPESRNTDDGLMHEFKTSYIMIALRSGKPVIPVVVDGNYGITRRAHILFGTPIDIRKMFSSATVTEEEIERVNREVYEKMLEYQQVLKEKIQDSEKR